MLIAAVSSRSATIAIEFKIQKSKLRKFIALVNATPDKKPNAGIDFFKNAIEITLTLARGHVAAPKTARSAHSALRSDQHVSVRANVVYRRAYRSLGSQDHGVLRFLGTAAGRWPCGRTNRTRNF